MLAELRAAVPAVAELGFRAVTEEVPAYAGSGDEEIGSNIQTAVELALGVFVQLLSPGMHDGPLDAARRGAYDLGRGEARSGRSGDALLAAYRIGARIAWREMSAVAVAHGTPASVVARFAELVFAYIDELSATSVGGHTDELAASGRLQRERRDRLARALLATTDTARLSDLAEQASWPPPTTLTAVLIPAAQRHDAQLQLASTTLSIPAEEVDLELTVARGVLLVPDAVRTRSQLLEVLDGTASVVGPPRPWTRAAESAHLAARAIRLLQPSGGAVVDTLDHLPRLVAGADLGALGDLRDQVLAPFAGDSASTEDRLTETLRAWLLHLGRRADVAAALHVHPQTVRYRMDQIRERYGDRLDDPAQVEALVLALTLVPHGAPPAFR